MNLFKEWQTKALFGFIVAVVLAIFVAVIWTAYIHIGMYIFVWFFGIIFFYYIGHVIHEIVTGGS